MSFHQKKSVSCTNVCSSGTEHRPHRLPPGNYIKYKKDDTFVTEVKETKQLAMVKQSPATTCIKFGSNDTSFISGAPLNLTLQLRAPSRFGGFVKLEKINARDTLSEITTKCCKEELQLKTTKLGDSFSDSEEPNKKAFERKINNVKTASVRFEESDAIEDLKPKTFSLDLRIDNMVTSVSPRKFNSKSWLYARNQFRNTQLKGNNSGSLKPPEDFHYLTAEGHRKFVNYFSHQLR